MVKYSKKELARDFIALGSIPFYFLVVIRSIIGEHAAFVSHTISGFIIYHLLARFIKPTDDYIARGLILVIFTSFFYQAKLFTTFVFVVWVLMFWAQRVRRVKWVVLWKGAVLGALSAGFSYIITQQIILSLI
jgi:hypothetical protein